MRHKRIIALSVAGTLAASPLFIESVNPITGAKIQRFRPQALPPFEQPHTDEQRDYDETGWAAAAQSATASFSGSGVFFVDASGTQI